MIFGNTWRICNFVFLKAEQAIPQHQNKEASVPKKLWCSKCQSAGHKADDCETQQYCFICNKTNHPMAMRRCPALKLSAHQGASASGPEEAEEQPLRSSSSPPQQSTPPLGVVGTGSTADITPSLLRRSRRHYVGTDGSAATDEDSMVKAMRRTTACNLDFEGTPCRKSFMSFDKSKVSSNITRLGVSLGRNEKEIDFSVRALKQVEFDRLTVAPKFSSFVDPLVSDEEDEDADANHEGKLLSHLVKDTTEVDLDDTVRDTTLCELVASVRKNKSNSGKKRGRSSKKAKVSKQKIGSA